MNVVKNVPANCVARYQVSKELSDDAQSVGFISMDRVVIFCEHVLKQFSPKPVEFTESLANEPKELIVSPLLTTTLDDHAGQFIFAACRKINAHELVASFLEAT
jgi:hypothetical protein